jgi:hypothetical protein
MTDLIVLVARVRELLDYWPETGIFTWRVDRRGGNGGILKKAGTVAGTFSKTHRYLIIQVDGRLYGAHRLAWLWMTSEWPAHQIDHKDTDRSNNRWNNLFSARIRVNGNLRWVGTFGTPEEAHAAYVAAKRQFHEFGTL